jgi:hypothetical protein
MVFHQVVVRVKKAFNKQETAFGVFLVIKGAFNYTCYDTMCDVLVSHGTEYTIVRWIKATMKPAWFSQPLTVIRVARDIQVLPAGRCVVTTSMVSGGR